ncbi:MAG: DNA mismatch repair protein MutS [Robiginitomaculum sp.]|nr:DNA mismatch repair protein MutS [Robiginitomaculum sp.]
MTRTKSKLKTGTTPMMAQYLAIRKDVGEALLFFRMGDFYELFFDDAIKASKALDITLTKRGQHLGKDIAMCGVPVVAADGYLMRLIEKGFKVAVCEQTESPVEAKKRGAKSVVRREVVRLVTPGTLTEDVLLDAKSANRLVAINSTASGDHALAWADVSTGEFSTMEFTGDTAQSQMFEALIALNPKEIITANNIGFSEFLDDRGVSVSRQESSIFRVNKQSEQHLANGFAVTSLAGFGNFGRAELGAMIGLYSYIELTQAGSVPKLNPPSRQRADKHLAIDPATRSSLEITRSIKNTKKGSLLDAVDRTVSAAGARVLVDRLERPSTDIQQINNWLDSISWLIDETDIYQKIRGQLKELPDLSRSFIRLSLGRGGPRDLAGIAKAAKSGEIINANIVDDAKRNLPDELDKCLSDVSLISHPELSCLVEDISKAFVETPPINGRDGGFITNGWSAKLDGQRELRDNSRRRIAALQGRYADKTAVASLKIKHNNVLGYFVEVTPRHAQALMEEPLNEEFRHRQTLGSAVRFSTDELSELETQILSAGERVLALEKEIYNEFLDRLLSQEQKIKAIAGGMAALDVFQSGANWALSEKGVRPKPGNHTDFEVIAARHPVVEQALNKDGQQTFTPNDCLLDEAHEVSAKLLFVTGPNMSGKSTWLRQNALLVIMMQAGLFVPAKKASIGLVDRLFSRVGASDDLSQGRSTFMVEMTETAAILNQATNKSFVILDEIGRGTATWDGLALAWATAEHLQGVNRSRALFATHYHELTALASRLPGIGNVCLKAKEWEGDLVFLHTVVTGAADRSYGIQVAKLAGMPTIALERAQQVLSELETSNDKSALADDLPLFAPRAQTKTNLETSKVTDRINKAQVDDMSPREALEFVYQLRDLAKKPKS